MKAKLVAANWESLTLFYELSEPVFKGTSDLLNEVDIPKSLSILYDALLPNDKNDAEKHRKRDGCYYVAIVIDRMWVRKHVFPAIKIRDGEYRFICDEIVGRHAKINNGEVPLFICPDEAYLQYLATLNDLYFGGIEGEEI